MNGATKPITEAWHDIYELYVKEGNDPAVSMRELATWAYLNKHADAPQEAVIRVIERQAKEALRRLEIIAPNGERVRGMVAAKQAMIDDDGEVSQQWLWCDVRKASYDHMIQSLRERRKQLEADLSEAVKEQSIYNQFYKPDGQPDIDLFSDLSD